MNKRKRVLLILFCIILVSLAAYSITRSGPKTMTLEVSGTAGLKVAGSYVADGNEFHFSGVVPTNFVIEAKSLTYSIRKLGSEGELQGTLWVDGSAVGLSKTPEPFGGVAGNYSFNSSLFHLSKKSAFTTVANEK